MIVLPLLFALLQGPAHAEDPRHAFPPALVAEVQTAAAPTEEAIAAAAGRIGALTGGALDELLHLLAAAQPGAEGDYDPPLMLGDTGRTAVLRAARLHAPSELRRTAVSFAAHGMPQALAALEALESCGSAEGLNAAVAVARAAGVEDRCRLVAALELDLARRLAADASLVRDAAGLARNSNGVLAGALVHAIADSGAPWALEELEGCLDWSPALGRDVLLALPGLVRGASVESHADLLERVRPHTLDEDPITAQAAFQVLGALGGIESAEILVTALGSEHAGVRRVAHRALVQASGMRFPEQVRPWSLWLGRERTWRRAEAPALLAQLESEESEPVLRALDRLAGHALFRDELGLAIEGLLEHEDVRVCVRACQVLARLGTVVALEALVRRLEDPEPELREAAGAALRSLTGFQLPAQAAAWRAALAQRGLPL